MVHGFAGSRVHESWVDGFRGSRVRGFTVSRVAGSGAHGLTGSGASGVDGLTGSRVCEFAQNYAQRAQAEGPDASLGFHGCLDSRVKPKAL